MIGVCGGNNRAQLKGFQNTRDLAVDLLGAKNAEITPDEQAIQSY
jgi:hypothetical protein